MNKQFELSFPQWNLVNKNGGMSGTLKECLDELFYSDSQRLHPEFYQKFKNDCLNYGYASVNGWTVYYNTLEDESSLNCNEINADS